jgi:hypothetical protein
MNDFEEGKPRPRMMFKTVEQRIAHTYIDMFPRFVPDEKASAGIAEQEEFYLLMKNLYQLIFENPLLLTAELHDDDAFPNRFHMSAYGKPELLIYRRKFLKAMNTLLQNMFLLGQGTAVKLSKKQLNVLSKLGVSDIACLPAAWTWMSARPEACITAFSFCLFNKNHIYTPDIYARLLGEEVFRKLENWMAGQGYIPYDMYHVTASDCKLSLSYANPAWGKERPNGGYQYKITHTGIAAQYDPCIQDPVVLGLCIPKGLMKKLIGSFDSMSETLRTFVIERTTKCWDCRYCVQTDKTGSRPLAYIPVRYERQDYKLCTYFPGYSYCWTGIDGGLAERLTEMLSFMDRFAPTEDLSFSGW